MTEEPGPFALSFDEWEPCMRCGRRSRRRLCDECMDELDRYAAESLRAIATVEEIDYWCYEHDIKRRN